jgi:hypothetical protein
MVRPPRPCGMTVQASLPGGIRLGRRWGLGPLVSGPGSRSGRVSGALSSFYWSSTSNEDNPDNACNVNFNDGNVDNDNKDNDNLVRAVRSGT